MSEVVITAVGADRPGIVAALSEALLDVGGNLEDARAALLRGSFAVMLAVQLPEPAGAAEARATLAPVAERLGLGLWVGEAVPVPAERAGERCVVSVYGADHPGIVHGFAAALAERGASIVDLSARVVGTPAVYVLGMVVELPSGLTSDALHDALRAVAAEHGVELAVEREAEEIL